MKSYFLNHEYFHNYEYRFLLRSPAHYQDVKGLKRCPSAKWWDKKYSELAVAFERFGLDKSGFSVEHTVIIEKVFKFKRGMLVALYH